MDLANDAVLLELKSGLLNPRVLKAAVARVAQRLCSARGDTYVSAVRRELAAVEQELSNLATAVAAGGDVPSILAAIRSREAQRRVLLDQLAHHVEIPDLDPASVLAELQARLTDWRELLRDDTPKGRGLLKQLIIGRLDMEPQPAGFYRFRGTGTLEPLLSGIVPVLVPQSVASLTLMPASWNQIVPWLQALDGLRRVA
jgi:hypothetical protein